MRLAATLWRARVSLTRLGSEARTICLGLMLSAIEIDSGQVEAARQASSITHWPMVGMMPMSSATGMKVLGGTSPRCGWFQRSSASNPTSIWLLALIKRLVDQVELAGRDRGAEVGLEPDPVLRFRLQGRGEIARAAAAGVLRLVEREVGLEDQIVDRGAVDRAEGAADRDADDDLGLVDLIGLVDRGDDPLAQFLDLLAALAVGDDDGEFIAAHAPDMAVGADLVDQPLGDRAEDRVALGVAVGVVDRLEPVEIEKHDRARHIVGGRRAQRLAEQLADAAAIGQAGEDIDIGEVGQALLRLADLGDVRADPAEALEAAGRVDDRVARHRDPARAALGLQFHFERVERLLLDQHAAELGMAAEQRRERMADQLRGRAAEQHAHARADVADAILAIDLPQPADTALLIFEQQLARAFALGADIGVGLELAEGPARDREDSEDRNAEREHQRQHVLEGDRIARDEQGADDAGGEHHHPGGDAGGNDDQAERGDAERGHHRGREQLRARFERREQIERQGQPRQWPGP